MSKVLVLIGGGGHASVLLDILIQQGHKIAAYVSPEKAGNEALFGNIPWLKRDEDIFSFNPDEVELVNGIGSIPGKSFRSVIFRQLTEKGYHFHSVICQSARISPHVVLQQGVQILSGSIVNVGSFIGENSILNTGCVVDHDCQIGADNHIAPGVTLSGTVKTGVNVHIGTGASVIQAVTIGGNTVVGAGACVTKDVEANKIVYPARTTIKPYPRAPNGLKLRTSGR